MKIDKVISKLECGRRDRQEDAFLSQPESGLFVVSDGFGGKGPGEKAAKLACESVGRFLEKEARDRDATLPFVLKPYYSLAGNVLLNAIVYANSRIISEFKKNKSNGRGGASVCAGFLDHHVFAFASFGTCSVELIRDGVKKEIVTPRSYARLLDPTGGLDQHPSYQFPVVALGLLEDIEPEIYEMHVEPGDWIILRTDGGVLNSDSTKEYVAQLEDPAQSIGSQDNGALVAIRFGS